MLRKPALIAAIFLSLFFGKVQAAEASIWSTYYQNYFSRAMALLRQSLATNPSNIALSIPTPPPTPVITNPVLPLSPTVTLTPSPTQVLTPTLTLTPSPTSTPSPTPQAILGTQDDAVKNYIMEGINAYRKTFGLAEVKTDSYTCDFAKVRAREISTSFNHTGFRDRINSSTLPYPSYSQITENIAMNSNYRNVVPSWIASSGHAENIRKDTPFVCVEKYGNYYAYEGWKP